MDAVTLIGLASAAGAVAGFYYSTQRADVKAVTAEGVPFADDRIMALRRRLRSKITITTVVLVLHLPLTALFITGAITAFTNVDLDAPIDATEVALVVIAGLALVHLFMIGGDLGSLMRRLKSLPVPAAR